MNKTKLNHQERLEKAMAEIAANQEACKNSPWRPVYHIAPPVGWMNDPNGFSYFNGAYHLFYQHHPYSSVWGPMHWGHMISRDLANWEIAPESLAPGEAYDKDGCFSGSALEKDGRLYIIYTGHVDLPANHPSGLDRIESQCMAVSDDGINFTKHAENPVIASLPEGDIGRCHFRDPKMWQHDGRYYCVVGAQTKSEHGQVLLFTSDDIEHWNFVNVMATSSGETGFMWECPSFESLGDTDLLICSPQGVAPQGKKFLNLHQSGYMTGKLDYNTGIFTHGEFDLLDYGFDFYAPQTMQAPDGRVLMIGWMDMWESPMPEQEYGWSCMMTVPRELSLENGKVFSRPVKELKLRRDSHIEHKNIAIESTLKSLNGVSGSHYELKTVFDMSDAETLTIKLRTSADEETVLTYNKNSQLLILNRDNSGAGPAGEREMPTPLVNNQLALHIFMDTSSVEIFVNDGFGVMSARIYPTDSSTGISFAATGTATLLQADFYTLTND